LKAKEHFFNIVFNDQKIFWHELKLLWWVKDGYGDIYSSQWNDFPTTERKRFEKRVRNLESKGYAVISSRGKVRTSPLGRDIIIEYRKQYKERYEKDPE